jgi:predicted metal-dependent hydrolase
MHKKEGRNSQASNQGASLPEECWHGQEEFQSAVRSWAARIGVQQPTVQFQVIPRSWATTDLESGVMSVASEVLAIPKSLGEYVIIHEMVHLLVPQARHGRLFKLFLDCYLPDWREREAQLQTHAQKAVC